MILLSGCDALPGKPTPGERPLRPEQVVDFDRLYGDNCAGCHGADGTLGAARPLNDPVYLALVGAARLVEVSAAGVPGSLMPGFAVAAGGSLTDRQIDIVVNGMLTRWGGGDPLRGVSAPPYTASTAGDTGRGGAAYAIHCAQCHGAGGTGGQKGGSVVDPAYLGLVSDQALRTVVICGRRDLGMPDWRGEGRAMSDQDVSDVVAWLIAQRPGS
jgi:mono/diheme cytochrome c family protein